MARYAPAMNKQDFIATVEAYGEFHDFEEECDEATSAEQIICNGLMCASDAFSEISKDLKKIKFDFENCDVDKFVTLKSGVTIALVMAGGDWEVSIYFAFYYDGKNFRAYIPTSGNVYNHYTKTAYGNADEAIDNADAKKHYGVDKYGDIESDIVAIMSDIESRIEARGVSGAVTFGKNAAAAKRKALSDLEPDTSTLTVIDPSLILAVVMPAASGSYVEFTLKPSGRSLTTEESNKIVGVPGNFQKQVVSSGVVWYSPDFMSSNATALIFKKAGFEIDLINSHLQDYNVKVIYI